MKKLFISLCVAIGLCGLATAQTERQKPADYILSNTTGDFLDLSKLLNEEDEAVAAIREANGIRMVEALGSDLAAGTKLNDYYYAFDETSASTLQIGAAQTNGTDAITTCPAFAMLTHSNSTFEFMETKVLGLAISAVGGIYFTDADEGKSQLVCPIANTHLRDIKPSLATCVFPSLVTQGEINGNYQATIENITATKAADKAPAYLALGEDIYGAFIIVQYDYMVGADEWIFQLKCNSDGQVACHIKSMPNTALKNNQYYRLSFGAKRDADTLLLGGMIAYMIIPVEAYAADNVWTITQQFDNRILSMAPKGVIVKNTDISYRTADVTLSLPAQTQRAISKDDAGSLLLLWAEQEIRTFTHASRTEPYAVGDKIGNATVIYSQAPTDYSDVKISQTGLKPDKNYYLYAFIGRNNGSSWTYTTTPILSEKIHTSTVLPPVAIKAGVPSGNKIPFTIEQPGDGLDMVVFKSGATGALDPAGQLTAGQTYENWKNYLNGSGSYLVNSGTVLELLPAGSTQFEVECEPGEMAYILVYSILDGQTDDPVYSKIYAVAPIYNPATQLPLAYTFTAGDEDPNASETLMPMLPPGMSTDMVADPNHPSIRTSAFAIQPESYFDRENYYLTSVFDGEFDGKKLTSPWPNVILPAFSGVAKVQATIFARLYQSGQGYGSVENHNWVADDSIRIEYKLNDGDWQPAGLFTVANKPDKDNSGLYPLTVTFECQPTDVVSLRYSYRFVKPTTSQLFNALSGYKIIEPRECKVPAGMTLVFEQTTDKQIQLSWSDDNTTPAGQYVVAYQKIEAEETDAWQTMVVNKTEATLSGLEANSAYNIQVTAVCGAEDTSSVSPAIRINTFVKLPYVENMAFEDWDEEANDYAKKPNVKVYTGTPGKLQEENYESDQVMTWNSTQCAAVRIDQEGDATALAVSCFMENAWLVTPGLYHKSNEEFPKALKFKIETFERVVTPASQIVAEYGIDLEDPDLRLYVIASEDGQFRLADTVAVYDHNALKAAETTQTATPREFSIDMSAYKTPVQIAFYFYNPNPIDMNGDGDPRELCLELSDLSFAYEGNPCFRIENPAFTATTADALSLTWESDEILLGYSLMWKTEEAADFTRKDSAFVTEPRYTIEGLAENTSYIVKIVAHCDAERTSAPVRLTNMTAESCHTPQNFTVTDVMATGATFSSTTDQTQARRLVYVTPQAGGKPQIFEQPGDQLTVTGKFTVQTAYVATTAAICGRDTSAMSEAKTFTTLKEDPIIPDTIATPTFSVLAGEVEKGTKVEIVCATEGAKVYYTTDGSEPTAESAEYKEAVVIDKAMTIKAIAIKGEAKSDVAEAAYTVKDVANEAPLMANFTVGTQEGHLYVRNLQGITVKDIDVYSLTGQLINRFALNSREDLILPIDAHNAILFVRLNTEKGLAVYKVYMK